MIVLTDLLTLTGDSAPFAYFCSPADAGSGSGSRLDLGTVIRFEKQLFAISAKVQKKKIAIFLNFPTKLKHLKQRDRERLT